MKVTVKRKRGSTSIRFEAKNSREGVDLKEAVTASKSSDMLDEMLGALGKRGYTSTLVRSGRSTTEFRVTKRKKKAVNQ